MTPSQLPITNSQLQLSPRERIAQALRHVEPDRVPTDFLATPEIWKRLSDHLQLEPIAPELAEYIDPAREAIMRHFEIDMRLLSYDMFCRPPESRMRPGAVVDWWGTMNRVGRSPSSAGIPARPALRRWNNIAA